MSAIEARVAAADAQFRAHYAGADEGFALLCELPGIHSACYDLSDAAALERMARDAVTRSERADVYFNVNVLSHPVPSDKRGELDEGDFAAVIGFVVDADIDPAKADKPHSREQVREFVDGLPLAPSAVVFSGRGVHLYWYFREALSIADADDREEVRTCSRQWTRFIARKAAAFGWSFDDVADLARMMRPAGTLNWKPAKEGGEALTVSLARASDVRYLLADLDDVIPDDITDQSHGEADVPKPGQIVLTPAERLAIVESVLPYWDNGNRHGAAMHVSGWLATNAVAEESALAVVEEASSAASDRDPREKIKTARDAYQRLANGRRPLGWNGLKAYVAAEHLDRLDATIRAVKIRSGVPLVPPLVDEDGHGNVEGKAVVAICAQNQDVVGVTRESWRAFEKTNDPPELFTFGGLPSRIAIDDSGGPFPQHLTEDRMVHELARRAFWWRKIKDPETGMMVQKHARPPREVARDMLAASRFTLPTLTRVTRVPTFAPDGSLPSRAGYHAPGRTYYAPGRLRLPSIPERPTAIHIAEARKLIVDELFGDFPFAGEADRAHAVALVMLPVVRDLIDGPTPLTLIDKPTAGTGASLLSNLVAHIATGRDAAFMTEARDEDEMRKKITATLRQSSEIVVIDNLRRGLDSGQLSALLTASEWEDRILGVSEMVRLPVRAVFIATGNNPSVSSEMSRRIVRIRLDAQRDRPWLRTVFRHPDIVGWAKQNRGRLVAACLTLARAWIVAGRPEFESKMRIGSFEAWSRVMGGVLEVAGVPGFLGNLREFYDQADVEGNAIRAFVSRWWETFGNGRRSAADLFEMAVECGINVGSGTDRSQRTVFGGKLRALRDQHYAIDADNEVRIVDSGKDTKTKGQCWALQAGCVAEPSEPSEPFDPRTEKTPTERPTQYAHRTTGKGSEGSDDIPFDDHEDDAA